ncbi:MAG: hypothetical protein RL413_960, partial [Actinomycetota bacterium]
MTEVNVAVPKVSLNGSPVTGVKADALVDARVTVETAAPAQAILRYHDPFFELLEGSFAKIGGKVEVSLPDSKGTDVVVFKGVIAAIAAEQGAADRHELVITAYDASQQLAHGLTPFTYKEMTIGDIVGKIAKRNGLKANTTITGKKMEYFLQLDTDHAVLDDLAIRTGAEWWVDGDKLHFTKRTLKGPIKLKWGTTLQRFSARFSGAGRVDDVTVRGWDPATQKSVKGVAKRTDVSSTKVGLKLKMTDTRAGQAKALKAKSTVTDIPVNAADEAKAIAEAMQADLAAGELHIRGEAIGQPKITAGATVEIEGAGKQLAGTFVVSRVEHVFGVGRPLISRFEGGRHAGGTLADQLVSAQRGSVRNRRQFAIGTVTNVKDPDKAGRVKVKLPTVSDADESAWARVVSPGAGNKRGLHLMPDVGDEVLVAFIGGDFRNPVVLGGIWSKKNAPPTPEPVKGDKVSERSLTLASGAKLVFTENTDKSKAVVALKHAEAETSLQFDKDGIKLNAKKGTKIKIAVGEASIEMQSDGTITIKGGAITIKADKNLT